MAMHVVVLHALRDASEARSRMAAICSDGGALFLAEDAPGAHLQFGPRAPLVMVWSAAFAALPEAVARALDALRRARKSLVIRLDGAPLPPDLPPSAVVLGQASEDATRAALDGVRAACKLSLRGRDKPGPARLVALGAAAGAALGFAFAVVGYEAQQRRLEAEASRALAAEAAPDIRPTGLTRDADFALRRAPQTNEARLTAYQADAAFIRCLVDYSLRTRARPQPGDCA